jgi:hypothetical protein
MSKVWKYKSPSLLFQIEKSFLFLVEVKSSLFFAVAAGLNIVIRVWA